MNRRIDRVLSISILSMLLPMVLATTVLKSSALLLPLYAAGFAVQSACLIWYALGSNRRLDRSSIGSAVAFFVILTVSFLNSVLFSGYALDVYDPINSLVKVMDFFLLYVVIKVARVDEKELIGLMDFVVGLSLVACIFMFLLDFEDILAIKSIANTNALNVSSFFSNRNQFSSLLITAFIANIYRNRMRKTPIRFISFPLQILGVLFTFSRSAFFCVGIVLFILLLRKKGNTSKLLLVLLVILMFCSLFVFSSVLDFILKNYLRLQTSADSGRFELWGYAWQIAKENWFLGVGFYTGVDVAVARGMKFTQFHSLLFDTLVDGGIPELVFYISIIVSTCVRCMRKCPRKDLADVCLAAFAAFAFHGLFESLSLFALSYADTLDTIFYVSVPLMLSNMKTNESQKTCAR